jgi:patatin-like phospholipase/acyl hydrolase
MKRILALDGGGIRGVFTLEVLVKIEEVLRDYYAKQDPEKAKTFVLRDHFDFLAGTSTGAIIATCLCWGFSAEKVKSLYLEEGRKMFEKASWRNPIRKLFFSHFDPGPLTAFLQNLFSEEDGTPAKLSSHRLRNGEKKNLLMVVVRNHTTGSAWPLTNNPDAIFNDPKLPDCNAQIPLWQLVRASTAAPTYFPEERITLGETEYVFMDGSITPYSNPALIAALTAILPGYRINWPAGPENIRLVSIGTLSFSSELTVSDPTLSLVYYAKNIPKALLQSIGWQQDYLCRCLGDCLFAERLDPVTLGGEKLDIEVGDLLAENPTSAPPPGRSWFSYVRYNRTFKKKEMQEILREHPDLASLEAVDSIPHLMRLGKAYAEANVKLEHLI